MMNFFSALIQMIVLSNGIHTQVNNYRKYFFLLISLLVFPFVSFEKYQTKDFIIEDFILTSDNKLSYILTNDYQIKEFFLMTVM